MELMALFLCCLALGWGVGQLKSSQAPTDITEKYNWNQDRLVKQWLPRFSGTDWPNFLAFLGMILVMVSASPLLNMTSHPSAIYVIFLSYAVTLWMLSIWVKRWLPWVGTTFLYVGLAFLPLNWVTLGNLDLAQGYNMALWGIACILLVSFAWLSFKILNWKTTPLFILLFSFLGAYSALSPGFHDQIISQYAPLKSGFYLLPFAFLCLGCLIELKYHLHRTQAYPPTIVLLMFMFVMIPVVNMIPYTQWGLCLAALGLLQTTLSIYAKNHQQPMSQSFEWQALSLWTLGFGLSLFEMHSFLIVCSLGFISFWFLALGYFGHWKRILYQSVSALALISGSLRLLYENNLSADIQSFSFSLLGLLFVLLAHWSPAQRKTGITWKKSGYYLALLLSLWTWVLFVQFQDLSPWTLWALTITALTYFLFALYHERNVLSYIGTATLCLAVFGGIIYYEPLTPFEAFRWVALILSVLLIGSAYLIQNIWPENQIKMRHHKKFKNWKSLMTQDLFQPFHFQERFASVVPYLICEPLYNAGLLLTSVAFLFDTSQPVIAFCASLIYLSVFKVYPSRIWIYFVILSMTDGALELMGQYLPERYQSWAFVSLSLGWFFTGVIIEEVMAARDRKNPLSKGEEDRKFAQPFFQAGILMNVWVLKYFFGDLQDMMTAKGWNNLKEEALPLLFTGLFYILKMRVYVSKLWIYPGLIVATIGLYFTAMAGMEWGLGSENTPAFCLLLFVFLGALWMVLGHLFNTHPLIQKYIQSTVAYRMPLLNKTSKAYQTHIAHFGSPFTYLAFSLLVMGQLFSLSLFPEIREWFYSHLYFSIKAADPILVYQVQSFLWAFAAGVWLFHYKTSKTALSFYGSILSLYVMTLWVYAPFVTQVSDWAVPLLILSLTSFWSLVALQKSEQNMDWRPLIFASHFMSILGACLAYHEVSTWLLVTLYWASLFYIHQARIALYFIQISLFTALFHLNTLWDFPPSLLFVGMATVTWLISEPQGLSKQFPELRWGSYAWFILGALYVFLAPSIFYYPLFLIVLGMMVCCALLSQNESCKSTYLVLSSTLILLGFLGTDIYTPYFIAYIMGGMLMITGSQRLPYGVVTQGLSPIVISVGLITALTQESLTAMHGVYLLVGLGGWVLTPQNNPIKDLLTQALWLALMIGSYCQLYTYGMHATGLLSLFFLSCLSLIYAYRTQVKHAAYASIITCALTAWTLSLWPYFLGSIGLFFSAFIYFQKKRLLVLRWPTEVFFKPVSHWPFIWPMGLFCIYSAFYLTSLGKIFTHISDGNVQGLLLGLLGSFGWISYLAYRSKHAAASWGINLLFHVIWIPFWIEARHWFATDFVFYHAVIITVCLSSMMLSKFTLKEKIHRDIVYVSGLCGLFFAPGLSAPSTEIFTFFSQGFYRLEWLIMLMTLLAMSFYLRIQIFLLTGVGLSITTLAIYAYLGIQHPLAQSGWLAWAGLLFMGIICIAGGVFFQTLAIEWKRKIERSWYAFKEWE